MTDKRSTRTAGNDIPSTGNASDKHRNAEGLENPKTIPQHASGYAKAVAGKPPQSDEKVPADRNEPLPQALAFFMLELQLGLRALNKLNEAACAEFDRITADEVMARNTIEPSELLEMNSFVELLSRELQALGQKAQIIFGHFRNSLLDAGVEAEELQARTNRKKSDWPSDEAERIKELMGQLSEKEMAIRAQIMVTLTVLFKLHEILETIRDEHGPFDRLDSLALLLAKEIAKIMKHFDGGELWNVLWEQPSK
jgi:hypothetical protein